MTIIAREPLGDFLVLTQINNIWVVIATTPSQTLAEQIAKRSQK